MSQNMYVAFILTQMFGNFQEDLIEQVANLMEDAKLSQLIKF